MAEETRLLASALARHNNTIAEVRGATRQTSSALMQSIAGGMLPGTAGDTSVAMGTVHEAIQTRLTSILRDMDAIHEQHTVTNSRTQSHDAAHSDAARRIANMVNSTGGQTASSG